jgi:hypothetical protein
MPRFFLPFLVLILCCLLQACGNSAPAGKSGPATGNLEVRFARVHYRDAADLQQLADRYDALEQVDRPGQTITLLLTVGQYEALLAQGYRIDVDEIQTARLNTPAPAGPQATGIAGYSCYRTVEETHATMQALAIAHPDLVELRDAGDSWLKMQSVAAGYDLPVARLTNRNVTADGGGDKPVFFLHAAIHAREYTTAETATRFIEHLVNGYGVDPDATWILDHTEVHVMPLANPDGRKFAEAHSYWRKNYNAEHCPGVPADPVIGITPSQGVDLNRNSSFGWGALPGGGSSGSDCDQTYRGPSAASEPETQAVENYARALFRDQRGPALRDAAPADTQGVFISLHNFAGLVLYPWSFTTDFAAPNQRQLETLGMKFGFFNHYTVCWDCLYLANGSTDDFVYGELGVASYTFELGHDGFFEDCGTFEATTYPDNLPALVYAAKASRRPYQNPFGPDVLELAATPAVAGAPAILTATADDTRFESDGFNHEPRQAIAEARYSIDAPSWKAASTFALQAVDGSYDTPVERLRAQIATGALAPGRHLVFVEARDASGNWGVPSAVFLELR